VEAGSRCHLPNEPWDECSLECLSADHDGYNGFGILRNVGGEIINPHKNLPRAAILGTAFVVGLYALAVSSDQHFDIHVRKQARVTSLQGKNTLSVLRCRIAERMAARRLGTRELCSL
jgi:hypothetical protein